MRLLPVRGPPAELEGTRRECPVCLEEITENVEWVSTHSLPVHYAPYLF